MSGYVRMKTKRRLRGVNVDNLYFFVLTFTCQQNVDTHSFARSLLLIFFPYALKSYKYNDLSFSFAIFVTEKDDDQV